MPRLTGMTWNHPRGRDPLRAATTMFRESHPDVEITWEARPLQGFEDAPVSELAASYDLIAIDHPFMGDAEGALLPLDDVLDATALADQAAHTVGPSSASYRWNGRQQALAMDAAAQVSACRAEVVPGDRGELPTTWDEVFTLADDLPDDWRMAIAANPTHLLASLFTLCHQNAADVRPLPDGRPPWFTEDGLDVELATTAVAMLYDVLDVCAPESWEFDPIGLLEAMAGGERYAYAPLVFGYCTYARAGYAHHRLRFGDAPAPRGGRPGTMLGGVGLAVSARTQHPELAARFAGQVCDGGFQRGGFVGAGGQPGHRSAWLDPGADQLCGGFFTGTLATLDAAFVRPRLPGYPRFQQRAGELLHDRARSRADPSTVVAELNTIWRQTVTTPS